MASSTIMMEVSLEVTKEAFRTKVETVVEERTTKEFSTSVQLMNTTRPAGLTISSVIRTTKIEAVKRGSLETANIMAVAATTQAQPSLLRHPLGQQQQQKWQHPWV